MMESIEKLREWRKNNTWADGYIHVIGADGEVETKEFDGIVEAIEREIAERYMPLPVDADKVVIRPGDIIYRKDMRYAKKKVPCVVTAVGTDVFACTDSLMRDASDYFHINTRTLTDVLADLFDRKISITDAEHEISELLGGDAK